MKDSSWSEMTGQGPAEAKISQQSLIQTAQKGQTLKVFEPGEDCSSKGGRANLRAIKSKKKKKKKKKKIRLFWVTKKQFIQAAGWVVFRVTLRLHKDRLYGTACTTALQIKNKKKLKKLSLGLLGFHPPITFSNDSNLSCCEFTMWFIPEMADRCQGVRRGGTLWGFLCGPACRRRRLDP